MCPACEREQGGGLQEGLTAAEGEPCEEWVFVEFGEHRTNGRHAPAGARLCVRIVTARTAARTALRKDCQPYALAVDDGVTCNPRDVDLSGVRA